MFDIHQALMKKQEHECARLDEFHFRHRARTIRLLAEWVRARMAQPERLDPQALAEEIAVAPDAALLDRLERHLAGSGVSRHQLERRHTRIGAEAYLQLVEEMGDPSPRQLA